MYINIVFFSIYIKLILKNSFNKSSIFTNYFKIRIKNNTL